MFTYDQALDYIWGTPSPSEDRSIYLSALLEELGNPHLNMKYVHIAGTNGKGSTSAFIYEILRASGYKTGLYTSPHLFRINERIIVDSVQIPDETLAELTFDVSQAVLRTGEKGIGRPSIFGLITAAAYLYFKRCNCDIVVLETGMGGRLDATNLISRAEVSAITNIGLDHTEFLGSTLAEISAEKAGIIKNGCSVVLYAQSKEAEEVIKAECAAKNASLRYADGSEALIKTLDINGSVFDYRQYKGIEIALAGLYQVKNAVTAINIAELLIEKGWRIDENSIRQGLKETRWAGRFEIVRRAPVVIADGTHNPQGTKALIESLEAIFKSRKIIFVLGTLSGKDYLTNAKLAARLAKSFYAVTPPGGGKALDANSLAEQIEAFGVPVEAFDSIPEALKTLMSESAQEDIICIFGTLYQIAEIKAFFENDHAGE